MKKAWWLLLGIAPMGFGFLLGASGAAAESALGILLPISVVCCFVATFQILEGTIKSTGLRVFLSFLLGAALLASDAFVALYIGCSMRPTF